MTYIIAKYDCPTEVTLAPIWPYVGGVACHLFGVASRVTKIRYDDPWRDGAGRLTVHPPAAWIGDHSARRMNARIVSDTSA
jgi:hypothetical protein